jgi:hypothetical protein
MESGMPDYGFGRCDGHHKMIDFRLEKKHRLALVSPAAEVVAGPAVEPHLRAVLPGDNSKAVVLDLCAAIDCQTEAYQGRCDKPAGRVRIATHREAGYVR